VDFTLSEQYRIAKGLVNYSKRRRGWTTWSSS
jgi:hypothetical protein